MRFDGRRLLGRWLVCGCLFSGSFLHAAGVEDLYEFENEMQASRYQQLVVRLRCPMCLNTSLEGSDAPISEDLRRQLQNMIIDGYSDTEIIDFMRARYGDFILYEPRLMPTTILLWFGPLLMLALGALLLCWQLRRASQQ